MFGLTLMSVPEFHGPVCVLEWPLLHVTSIRSIKPEVQTTWLLLLANPVDTSMWWVCTEPSDFVTLIREPTAGVPRFV